jgi:hypothetical protein
VLKPDGLPSQSPVFRALFLLVVGTFGVFGVTYGLRIVEGTLVSPGSLERGKSMADSGLEHLVWMANRRFDGWVTSMIFLF